MCASVVVADLKPLNIIYQQLFSVAKACHIFTSSTGLSEDYHECVNHLTSVVHAASGKREMITMLVLHLCG